MTVVAEDTRPDLAKRLAQAQRDEQPLAAQVAHLEHAMAVASHECDFAAAHAAQQALPAAREAHAIAAAHTASLLAAVSRTREAQAADERTVALAKQQAQARQEYEQWRAKEAEEDTATDEALAACRAGLDAIRANYADAVAHSQAADQARSQCHRCLVVMDGVDYPPVAPRRRAQSALADQVLAVVVRNSAW